MYQLKRITTVPNSPLRIMVDRPLVDDPDAGLGQGGSFQFLPAGQDGDTATVGAHAAKAIMGDPGLAEHFECTPPWADPDQVAAPTAADPDTSKGIAATPGRGGRWKA